jgi:hypothetical protein
MRRQERADDLFLHVKWQSPSDFERHGTSSAFNAALSSSTCNALILQPSRRCIHNGQALIGAIWFPAQADSLLHFPLYAAPWGVMELGLAACSWLAPQER